MSATSLDRRNLVSEMLRRVPEASVAFSEEESNWMSDPIDFDRFGPHMLIGLLETVLCTRLLLPLLAEGAVAATSIFLRVNALCDDMLASEDQVVRNAATVGILESMAIGQFDASFVLSHIEGRSRETVIQIREAHGHA